ncbi:MAG: NUDIX domain-containing protein [Candidatus Abawacabacteria bacterium]|nr:NUDIX domain-containing protein [Candidatus Abawacabacteria bacterium]
MKRDVKKEILATLLKADRLKYGDIHPEGIGNDLFNYHLQHLVKMGLVSKDDKIYSLSNLGKYHVAEQNPLSPSGRTADRFKMNVLTVVLRGQGKNLEVLMQTRKRHPFYDSKSVMGGTIRKGELVAEAAQRKLKTETGLTANLKLCGLIRQVNLDKQNVLVVEDVLFHICCTDLFEGELLAKTDYGENFWCPIEQAIQEHKKHHGSLQLLVKFFTALKKQNFRDLPLFYWEKKSLLNSAF